MALGPAGGSGQPVSDQQRFHAFADFLCARSDACVQAALSLSSALPRVRDLASLGSVHGKRSDADQRRTLSTVSLSISRHPAAAARDDRVTTPGWRFRCRSPPPESFLYLRRHVAAPAAAFGAIVFAVAGPTVSTTNFPNLSWSVVCVPFVFWSLDRLAERGRAADAALVAVIVSAQALAGEPVTLAATLVVAAAYVAWPLGASAQLAAAGHVRGRPVAGSDARRHPVPAAGERGACLGPRHDGA